MDEHVILVAHVVVAESYAVAEGLLQERLNHERDREVFDSWWIAMDERYDGSDCDSAVFVIPGAQAEAFRVLRAAGLAH